MASSFELQTPTAYEIPFTDFISGTNLGPYAEKGAATNDVAK
jgi:hypothetical protein